MICPRCRQHGGLPRLSCGHYALPGSLMVTDSEDGSNYQCPQCSPLAGLYGNQRLGLAQGPERA